MRQTIPGLETPRPLGPALPAVFQEDLLLQRFMTAFDDVIAPIFCTLDNLDSYFDPRLTPPDFLGWLAGWLGLTIDDNWPLQRRRTLASEAAGLYRWRGTVKGLATEVALHTGGDPEVAESGGVAWSSRPGGPIPGTRDSFVRVVVRVDDPAAVNVERLNAMVAGAIPADVTHELYVLSHYEEFPIAAPEPQPVVEQEPVEPATPETASDEVAAVADSPEKGTAAEAIVAEAAKEPEPGLEKRPASPPSDSPADERDGPDGPS